MYTVTHWEILQFKQLPLWYQKIYKKKMLKESEKNGGVDESVRAAQSTQSALVKVRFPERKRAANGALFDVSSRTPTHTQTNQKSI